MSKILNPFEYLSTGKAWWWGITGTLFAIMLLVIARLPINDATVDTITILSSNLLVWLPLSTLLYLAALVFSPSRIRAVDIFASNLFSLLPSIVGLGIISLITAWLRSIPADPQSVAGVIVRACYILGVIILSVTMVWSIVWGCFAYSVSANIKGPSGVVIFVICYVFVSVVVQTTTQYLGPGIGIG